MAWELVLVEWPNGVPKHWPRKCEACGGPKRRRRAQYTTRWLNDSDVFMDSALISCSIPCAEILASELALLGPPKPGGPSPAGIILARNVDEPRRIAWPEVGS